MRAGVAARVAAATMLGRVLDEGAFSNRIVGGDPVAGLSDRDRRFAQHLLYQALRDLPRIDRALVVVSGRDVARIDPEVLHVLRIGASELLAGTEAVHAAVDGAVEGAREMGAGRAAGFVNAVLRRLARDGGPELPDGEEGAALRLGVAPWLLRSLEAAHGSDEAASMLSALRTDAAVGVRVRRADHGVEFEQADGFEPGVGYATGGSGLAAAVAEGAVVVIDPASSAVASAVGAAPGETVIDIAAAPGGKTAHLADAMEGRGMLVAADRHHRRVVRARRRLRRMEIDVPWIVMDGTSPAVTAGIWDAVLLDAPCTGLGTLRRRPEIAIRLDPGAPVRMGNVQRRLLDRAVGLVGPGGRVVYSVCTMFPEETVDVVDPYPAAPPEGIPGVGWGKGLLLGPHTTGTDGMFIAVIRG